jgi:DNA-binding NtrC family response regulator
MQTTGPDRLIVVADDDPAILALFRRRMGLWGYPYLGVANRQQLLGLLAKKLPCLLILDVHFGDCNGIELLEELLHQHPDLLVVVLSGDGTIENAVAAVKRGAYDFLPKPADWLRLEMILRHAVERQDQRRQIRSLEESVGLAGGEHTMLGDSPSLRRVRVLIDAVAPTDAPVLILGETGTGKELVARQLHQKGSRSQGPFIAINMTALPEALAESALFGHNKGAFTGADRSHAGCFERADRGTLFLDEIGDMDLGLQAKLLRVLQEQSFERLGSGVTISVKCRVVAATNRDLEKAVEVGSFREDLYYRLNVMPINLPPLRERRDDIPLLASRFLRRAVLRYHKEQISFSPPALELLTGNDWPGNVRQLENLIERLVILTPPGTVIDSGAIAQEIHNTGRPALGSRDLSAPAAPQQRMDEIERRAILEVLERSRGRVRVAAESLGLSLATIYRKLKRYNIALPTNRTGNCAEHAESF